MPGEGGDRPGDRGEGKNNQWTVSQQTAKEKKGRGRRGLFATEKCSSLKGEGERHWATYQRAKMESHINGES